MIKVVFNKSDASTCPIKKNIYLVLFLSLMFLLVVEKIIPALVTL